MTARERETLGDVLRMLAKLDRKIDAVAADVAGVRQAILSHRDRIARLEACLDADEPVDPAA